MAAERQRAFGWLLATVVLGPLPLRAWLAETVGLAPDEMYYFGWSRRLAAGYLDHPPAVAWIIRAGTEVGGDGRLGIRLGALALGGVGMPLVLALLAREAGLRGRLALLLPASAALLPLGLAAGLLMTPDVPLLLCWTLAAALLLRARRTGRIWAWVGAGVAAGAALLSKHSAWVLLASVAVGILGDGTGRRQLRGPGPWLSLALALAVAAPNLAWDLARGAPSLGFQLAHGTSGGDSLGAPLRLLELVGGQVGLLTPLVALGCVFFLRRGAPDRAGGRLLVALAAGPLVVFGAAALLAHPEANWPAPAHPALLAGALLWLQSRLDRAADDPAQRRRLALWTVAALGTGLVVSALGAAHLLRPLPFPPAAEEPAARLRAWEDLPPWLEREGLVAADGYELAAALAYELRGRATVLDGRREALPAGRPCAVVAVAPGSVLPTLPSWAPRSARPLGARAMRRSDGRAVRTLSAWSAPDCSALMAEVR